MTTLKNTGLLIYWRFSWGSSIVQNWFFVRDDLHHQREYNLNKQMEKPEEEYKADFDQDDKNHVITVEYQAQTARPASEKQRSQENDNYEQDFVEPSIEASRAAPSTHKKYYDNTPNRQKMIEQNMKLKSQILELAQQMDQIAQREKKNKKYGIHAQEGEDDETLKNKKQELKKQQLEIMNLKNKIMQTKKQLEHVYDSRGVQGKEDELKNLQKELKVLQDEKEGLLKVKREQTKALKLIRNDTEYEDKVKSLKEQVSQTREQCKHLSDKLLQNERLLRKNHEIFRAKQAKIKQMEVKIKQNKQRTKKTSSSTPSNTITNPMIQQLQDQLTILQNLRKETERSWYDKIQTIDVELQQKKIQEEKKELMIKQKEKELKLNQIRIKELKKLIQHHSTEPAAKKVHEQQPDMKEYRHRRNIKHLEK